MSGAGFNPPAPGLYVLIGTGAGYSSLVQAALRLQRDDGIPRLLVLFGAEDAFAFRPRPSTILVPGMPAGVIASIPALEEVGIASRLASTTGLPGCHDGTVTELAEHWLRSLESDLLARTQIAVVSAETLSSAVKQLGRTFQVPVIDIPDGNPP
jgi:dihydroorotate dehydrogenase electron transfer subunit